MNYLGEMEDAAVVAERGYRVLPSCIGADLVIRIHLDLSADWAEISVTNGDSGDRIYHERRDIEAVENDLNGLATHFHQVVMEAKQNSLAVVPPNFPASTVSTFEGRWMGIACLGGNPIVLSLSVGDTATLRGMTWIPEATPARLAAYAVEKGKTYFDATFPNNKGTLSLKLAADGNERISGTLTVVGDDGSSDDLAMRFVRDNVSGDLQHFLQANPTVCETEEKQ